MNKISVFLMFVIIFITHFSFASEEPEVRILIDKNVSLDTLTATTGKIKTNIGLEFDQATAALRNGTIEINGQKVSGDLIKLYSDSNSFKYKNKTYSNMFTIVKSTGSLLLINNVSLEDYLVGIVSSEIGSKWPIESAKAQAVASRTYALKKNVSKKDALYDLETNVNDQVYLGTQNENSLAKSSVEQTKGEVLLKEGKIIHAYFHSCCGGMTELASHVWQGAMGPQIIEDPYCKMQQNSEWTLNISKEKISSLLTKSNRTLSPKFDISATKFENSPRVDKIIFTDDVGMQMVGSNELRKILGYNNLRSTWFELKDLGEEIEFTGKGFGHGVGMCQWGARGMASSGKNYKEILDFYYNGTKVVKLY